MADFGARATELSPARGAGAEPIRGVVEAPSTYQFPSAAISVAGEALTGMIQDEKKQRIGGITGNFIRELTTIASGRDQGQLKPHEADGRIEALGKEYSARYAGDPEAMKALVTAKEQVLGLTSLGSLKVDRERAAGILDQQIKMTQAKGINIPADATPAEMRPALDLGASMERAEIEAKRVAAAAAERRAQNSDNRAQTAEERAQFNQAEQIRQNEEKRTAITLLTDTASKGLDFAAALPEQLAERVKAGKLSRAEAEFQLSTHAASTAAFLQTIAGQNPELAKQWSGLFDDLAKAGIRRLDPNVNSDELNNQVKDIINKGKLVALADPKVRALVVADQMMPGTAVGSLENASAVMGVITAISNADAVANGRLPQVVASPDPTVERGTYKTMREALDNLQAGKAKDPAVAATQNKNAINTVLVQVGDMLNNGKIKDKDFVDVSDFMASPQFAYAVKQGLLTPEAREGARAAWQVKYQRSVIGGVRKFLNAEIPADVTATTFGGGPGEATPMPSAEPAKVSLAQTLDLEFNGVGIQFVPNGRVNTSGRTASTAVAQQELQRTTTAVNQLIQVGAHLEGTTDYAGYWEKNKATILPDYFNDPRNLKPGQVVNGYKFLGIPGATTRDKRNWEKADGKQ